MFGIFKKKTEKEKLTEQYESLLNEAFLLSKSDRKASDLKTAKAQSVLEKMEQME